MKPNYKAELEKLGFELICYKQADYFTEDRIAIAVKTSEFAIIDTKFLDLRDAANLYKDKENYNSWGFAAILCQV